MLREPRCEAGRRLSARAEESELLVKRGGRRTARREHHLSSKLSASGGVMYTKNRQCRVTDAAREEVGKSSEFQRVRI